MKKIEAYRQVAKECGITKDDVFKHNHYTIFTRSGIEKIANKKGYVTQLNVITSTPTHAAVHMKARNPIMNTDPNDPLFWDVETTASALYGLGHTVDGKWIATGNTNSHYVLEVAEKRAKSRCVLMLVGLYEHNYMGEDELEENEAYQSKKKRNAR